MPWVLLAVSIAIWPPPADSQATAGSILGCVVDPTQALVPGATVSVRNAATSLARSTQTNVLGTYLLPDLPPGTYTLTVEKENFAPAVRQDLQLAIDRQMRVDITLAIATATQEATVAAGSPILETQSAATGEVIASSQILDLPLLGRNFLDLARLTAGVVNGSGGNTLNVSVNGQREFANSILVDGIEVSANRNNDTTLRPSVDAVEEFKILTGSYRAEFGRASGAVIAIQTKAGTNQVHGDLYEFFRPSGTAAKSFFATDRSPLKQSNLGGALGGPVRRDKTFWYGSYERVRLRNAFSFLDSVPPTAQTRFLPNGDVDLSGLRDPFTGKTIPIFDPAGYATNYYSAPFPDNIIPANRVSAAGKAILHNFFPAPTRPGIYNGWFNNFVSRQAYAYDSDAASGRVDHFLSPKDRVAATYHYGSFASHTGDRFAGSIPVEGGGDADYGDDENSRNQSFSISESHLLSGRLWNDARFGYTRYRLDQRGLLDGRNLAAQYGLGNVNLAGYPQTSGFPDVFLGFGAQTGGSTYKPLYFRDGNTQLSDNVSAQLGAHDLKAGVVVRTLKSNPFFALFPTGFQYYGGPGLSLTSDPNYSFYDGSAFYYNGGSDIADLLLGLPYTVNLGLQQTDPTTHSWEGSAYLQDEWRLTSRLVLSYGLRYEYFAPWTEGSNRAANFDPASREIALAGRGGNSASLVAPDRNNFAPRLGLAWRAESRTVVRAGWGIFYSPENDAREDLLTKNYPFAVRQTVFNDIFGGLPFPYSLDAGVSRITSAPLPPDAASLDPAAVLKFTGARQDAFLVDSNLRTGYSQSYNVTIQRELATGLSLDAGYVGSVSRKLPYAVGNLNANNRLTPSLGQVQGLLSEGSASYHSLQVKAVRRFSEGFHFLAAYTFGKNIDNGPAPFNLGHNQNSNNRPQSPFNLALERAVADNDITHNYVLSSTYELPFGRGRRLVSHPGDWSEALLGGWQINGILVLHSGLPVNVVRNSRVSGLEGLRPDVVRDPNLPASERTLTRYFDTGAFTATRFAGSHKADLGDAGRNLVRGPGLANLDLSVFKEQRFRESVRIELRFEFFDVTNTPHFANPDGNLSDGNFGSIAQTVGNPRIVQFAAKLKW